MSAVTNSTILSNSILSTRDVLQTYVGTTITDPQSGNRAANQPFIRTTRARKSRYYPHIVIDSYMGPTSLLSLQGDQLRVEVMVQISVFSRSVADCDKIMGQVMEAMRDSKTAFKGKNLHRARGFLDDISPLITDEEEIHHRAATFRFVYYAQ